MSLRGKVAIVNIPMYTLKHRCSGVEEKSDQLDRLYSHASNLPHVDLGNVLTKSPSVNKGIGKVGVFVIMFKKGRIL